MRVEAASQFFSNERVASHERMPREIARPTPIADSVARRNHESGDGNDRNYRWSDAHDEEDFSARAGGAFPEERFAQTAKGRGDHRRRSVDGQQ
jgi:hypothetical protein